MNNNPSDGVFKTAQKVKSVLHMYEDLTPITHSNPGVALTILQEMVETSNILGFLQLDGHLL